MSQNNNNKNKTPFKNLNPALVKAAIKNATPLNSQRSSQQFPNTPGLSPIHNISTISEGDQSIISPHYLDFNIKPYAQSKQKLTLHDQSESDESDESDESEEEIVQEKPKPPLNLSKKFAKANMKPQTSMSLGYDSSSSSSSSSVSISPPIQKPPSKPPISKLAGIKPIFTLPNTPSQTPPSSNNNGKTGKTKEQLNLSLVYSDEEEEEEEEESSIDTSLAADLTNKTLDTSIADDTNKSIDISTDISFAQGGYSSDKEEEISPKKPPPYKPTQQKISPKPQPQINISINTSTSSNTSSSSNSTSSSTSSSPRTTISKPPGKTLAKILAKEAKPIAKVPPTQPPKIISKPGPSSKKTTATSKTKAAMKSAANTTTKKQSEIKSTRKRKRVTQEIRKLRRDSAKGFLIPKLPISRLVRELLVEQQTGQDAYRVTAESLIAIQTILEVYLTKLFEDSYLFSNHGKRVTLQAKDIMTCRRIRGPGDTRYAGYIS